MNELPLGSHVSIAGGMEKAIERGARLNCNVIQLFLKNSNQWLAKPLSERDQFLFRDAWRHSDIHTVIAHDSYLINLASPDRALRLKSLNALVEEMQRAVFLGIERLVMHPGAHMGAGIPAGVKRVAAQLNRAIERVDGEINILLENTAGQGSCLGHRFEHLSEIMGLVKDDRRMGICFDTCHAYAAGYDIGNIEGYEKTMREADRYFGIEKIAMFHCNDSKKGLGSRVDRHEHIGQGAIGLEAFRLLINDPRFRTIPKILETPKGPGIEEDVMNLVMMRSLEGARSPS
jgi:deoxyribonuclease-4